MHHTPDATTRVFALLGDPVAHSLSPVMQNAAIRHARLDAVYVALRCDTDTVAPLIRALCHAGGGGNVTVPHKHAAAACIERPTAAVQRTGACNTFWGDGQTVCGDNTDVAAIAQAATRLAGSVAGASALVLGAGGAAAAAVCALLDAGAASVLLVNRTVERAHALAGHFAEAGFEPADGRVRVADTRALERGVACDLVVNATSLGLHDDDPLPLDLTLARGVSGVLDLVYARTGTTAWVRQAEQLGIAAADGLEVLVGQGAAAFTRWFGVAPDPDVMRHALER